METRIKLTKEEMNNLKFKIWHKRYMKWFYSFWHNVLQERTNEFGELMWLKWLKPKNDDFYKRLDKLNHSNTI